MSEDVAVEEAIVIFEYRGTTFAIPVRLVELQRRWNAAHAECVRVADLDHPESVAAYRAARDARMAATLEKLDDPWLTGAGVFRQDKDLALRAYAADRGGPGG